MGKWLTKGLVFVGLWLCLAMPVRAEADVHGIEEIRTHEWPRLGQKYEFLGPGTKKYNCIAWSLGITSRWVWPGDRVEDFDKLYEQYGYRRLTKLDYRLQDGVEKVVLYGRKKDKRVLCTHAARQMPDGNWTNKLGSLPLIKVPSPDHMDGPGYGSPVAVYVRKKPARSNNVRLASR